MRRHSYWVAQYEDLRNSGKLAKKGERGSFEYTVNAYEVFPRYLVWQAILDEVERTQLAPTMTADTLRNELIEAGWRAQTLLTNNPALPARATQAMDEERSDFARFVASVTDDQAKATEPLPYRRVFRSDELDRLWDNLRTKWGAERHHYWWPLTELRPTGEVLAFHTDWFDHVKVVVIREALINHGVNQVWELREGGDWGCEFEVSRFDPRYIGGEEGYWTSSGLDWLLYASHESSIAVGGQWLVDYLQQRFPGAKCFEYRGPYSTPDLRGTWRA